MHNAVLHSSLSPSPPPPPSNPPVPPLPRERLQPSDYQRDPAQVKSQCTLRYIHLSSLSPLSSTGCLSLSLPRLFLPTCPSYPRHPLHFHRSASFLQRSCSFRLLVSASEFVSPGGRKVAIFAGGTAHTKSGNEKSAAVDTYDASRKRWGRSQLSEGRTKLTCAAVGPQIFVAGGYSDTVSVNRADDPLALPFRFFAPDPLFHPRPVLVLWSRSTFVPSPQGIP